MSDCSKAKNPLVRNGTSQPERFSEALSPSSVKIDEKTIQETIAFTHAYAQCIKYYGIDNQSREDWQELLATSNTVMLAIIAMAPYQAREDHAHSLFDDFLQEPTDSNLQSITTMIFQMASEVQGWNEKASPKHSLRSFLLSEIETQLQTNLISLARIDKSIDPVNDYSGFFTSEWSFDETAFNDLEPIEISDVSDLVTVADDLKTIHTAFFQTYVKTILKARELFQSHIETDNDHEPHMVLFIAFLYLFQYAKDSLNNLTKRHLDFYYKKVLHLKKNEPIPDKVHILFELAENYTSHALPKGTGLKAGKDSQGKALSYELTEETVLNRAFVDQLKTVYIDPRDNYKVYAAVKADSPDGRGGEFGEDSDGSWKPFGSKEMPESRVGIAIASPILLLKEGNRTITVTLNLNDPVNLIPLQNNFTIQVSAEETWLDVLEYRSGDDKDEKSGFEVQENTADNTLEFVVNLHSGDPPVVPFNNAVLKDGFDTAWPVIKIHLNEKSEKSPYGHLKDFKIETITIKVDCRGIRDLIIQNDQTIFAPEKAFHPFGPRPAIGSNFYIGSEEVFGKRLTSLSLVLEWLDLPPSGDFEKHYCVYNSILNENIRNDSFKVKISYLRDKIWMPLFGNTPRNLFSLPLEEFHFFYFPVSVVYGLPRSFDLTKLEESPKSEAPAGTEIIGIETYAEAVRMGLGDATYLRCKPENTDEQPDIINFSTIDLGAGSDGIAQFDRYEGILGLDTYTSHTQRGFLRLRLSGKDFQHSKYSEVYTKQALKLANGITDETTTIFPNEPYTPTMRSLYLDYSSSVEMDFAGQDSKNHYDSRIEQIFHIGPFGQQEVHPYLTGEDIRVVPQFTLDEAVCTGHLLIGLRDALPSQVISLLFQIYQGSGNPEKEIPDIAWLYLNGNQWYPLTGSHILEDTTNGLVQSGIIRFLLPSHITSGNTVVDESCLWIKACIREPEEIDALPDMINVKAQAAIASFRDNDNSTDHLESALPPETITSLSQRTAAVTSVSQPYASFGGKTKEIDQDFYRRISERLRHKNRAITIWDYERLVLQEFSSLHRVKCLNHTSMDTEIAPGHVMIVVIPDLRNKNAVNVLEPQVDVGTLEEIRDFLSALNTPFVKGGGEGISDLAGERLKVVNPLYEQVRVTMEVKMKKNYDPQHYRKVLNDDLKRFLAPWAYSERAEIGFGSVLHRSSLLHFIEKLGYVDYLTDLVLEHYKGETFLGRKDEIRTTSARSILTSYGKADGITGLEHNISTDVGCF